MVLEVSEQAWLDVPRRGILRNANGKESHIETMIEFTHRATSGLALLMTIALVIAAHRLFAPKHRVRRAARTTLGFMIAEALLGASLVIFGLVENDDSIARAVVMCMHLLNTLALLGFMALTAHWSQHDGRLNLQQPIARWCGCSRKLPSSPPPT